MVRHPAFIFAPALAVFALLALARVRWVRSPGRAWPALLAVPAVCYVGLCAAYVRAPSYIDHLEPSVAMQSLLVARGRPVYTDLDSPERSTLCYGPTSFLTNAAFVATIADPILATKLCGAVQAIGSLLLVYVFAASACGRRVAWLCTVHAVLIYLLFDHISYWDRPDSLLLLAAALACAGALVKRRWLALVLASAGVAIAVDAKAHSVLALTPPLVLFLHRHGWRWTVGLTALAAALAVLPFAAHPSFDAGAYVQWLRAVARHPVDLGLAGTNVQYAIPLLVPVLLAGCAYARRVPMRDLKRHPKLHALLALLVGFALTAAIAAKSGAGPHHLLPFAPVAAALLALFIRDARGRASRPAPSNRARAAYACVLAAWAVTVAAGAVVSQTETVRAIRDDRGRAVRRDLQGILDRHRGRTIVMGFAAREGYELTYFRPVLFHLTGDNFLDPPALMDMQASGIEIPRATVGRILEQRYDIFLIPRPGEPFSMTTWYSRRERLAGDLLPAAFRASYTCIEQTDHYAVWQANRLTRS